MSIYSVLTVFVCVTLLSPGGHGYSLRRRLLQNTCATGLCSGAARRDVEPINRAIDNGSGQELCTCTCDDTGNTLLHVAAVNEAIVVANTLLNDVGCDPNVMDNDGNAPIHDAASVCQNPMTNLFLDESRTDREKRNNAGDTPLCVAARQPNENCGIVVRSIGEKGGNLCNECGDPPTTLPHDVTTNQVVQDVIAQDGGSPAACAAGSDPGPSPGPGPGPGPDPTPGGSCPDGLCAAANRRDEAFLNPFVSSSDTSICACTCDADGNTPLHYAAVNEAVSFASRILTELGCNPNVADNDGNAPIHDAASVCQNPMTNLFLDESRTDREKRNNAGDTPLCVAARQPNENCGIVVRSIGEKGGDLCNECGDPPTVLPHDVATNQVVQDVIAQDGGSPAACAAGG